MSRESSSWMKRETPHSHLFHSEHLFPPYLARPLIPALNKPSAKVWCRRRFFWRPLESGAVSYWPLSCLSLPFQVCIGSGATEEKHNQAPSPSRWPSIHPSHQGPLLNARRPLRAAEAPRAAVHRGPSLSVTKVAFRRTSSQVRWHFLYVDPLEHKRLGRTTDRHQSNALHRDICLTIALWRCVFSPYS